MPNSSVPELNLNCCKLVHCKITENFQQDAGWGCLSTTLLSYTDIPELSPDNQRKKADVGLNFLCPEGPRGVMGKSWLWELEATRFQ